MKKTQAERLSSARKRLYRHDGVINLQKKDATTMIVLSLAFIPRLNPQII